MTKPTKTNTEKLGLDAIVDPELTPAQKAELEKETARQKELPKGWHAIKDLTTGSRSARYRWTHYVCYFARKGADYEESLLRVTTESSAEWLAATLNKHLAIPAWL